MDEMNLFICCPVRGIPLSLKSGKCKIIQKNYPVGIQ